VYGLASCSHPFSTLATPNLCPINPRVNGPISPIFLAAVFRAALPNRGISLATARRGGLPLADSPLPLANI
jgi:hypothetical protein